MPRLWTWRSSILAIGAGVAEDVRGPSRGLRRSSKNEKGLGMPLVKS